MAYEGETPSRSRLEFGPAPASFDTAPVVFGTRDPRALSTRGLCHWLAHDQVDLTGPEPVHTHRSVMQVTGSEGLQPAARFEVSYNPQYERVVIHAVRVHRGGETREAAAPEAFEIIQRELNMERAVYDGRMTAHMVIPDVREGDVVEMIHSIIGANPALKGRFAWSFILQWSESVVETRCTVRAAANRKLTSRRRGGAGRSVESVANGVRTLDWRAVDLPPYVPDRGSPLSWVGYASVNIADSMSWAEVADVFRQSYEPPAELPEDLSQAIAAIAERDADPAHRLVNGLRLVQGALRYHSVSVGEGGYRPRPLEQIWRTRYGDCKDGSVLLAAVLGRLGIDAVCALVNTATGDGLPDMPPNPLAFNHCIVRARIGREPVWLDATQPPQAGDLAHLVQAHFHWALPLTAQAALEPMAAPRLETVCETREIWTFARQKGRPADLEMTTSYRGWRADSMRHWMANEGAMKVSRNLRQGLEQEVQSPLRELEPVVITDDAVGNVLTTVERYEVERPFQKHDRTGESVFFSRDDVVGPQLTEIGPERRREPLQLGLARRIATTRTFRFPVPVQIAPWRERLTGPAGLTLDSAFEWRSAVEGVHHIALTVGEPLLPSDRADDYRDFVYRARGMNGVTFAVPFKGDRMAAAANGRSGAVTWLIWGLIAAAVVAARIMGG